MTAPALLVLPLRMGTGKVPIQQVIFGFLWENRWFRALILRLAQLREWLSMDVVARTQVVLVIGCSTSDLDT